MRLQLFQTRRPVGAGFVGRGLARKLSWVAPVSSSVHANSRELGGPRRGGMLGDPEQMHPARVELNDEEHVEPGQAQSAVEVEDRGYRVRVPRCLSILVTTSWRGGSGRTVCRW